MHATVLLSIKCRSFGCKSECAIDAVSACRRYLDAFFQRLDYEPIERFCRACLDCKGTIVFTGVGKSGFIAQKISQTLVSMMSAVAWNQHAVQATCMFTSHACSWLVCRNSHMPKAV